MGDLERKIQLESLHHVYELIVFFPVEKIS